MNEAQNRIPSLDGLRAISILFVLFSHAVGTHHFLAEGQVGPLLGLGELGVRVFFVISGYLITTLLLEETARYGRIDLGRFYLRRTMRIFPAFYAFVLALIVLEAVGLIALNPGDKLHALTYTSNYDPDRSWYVGHTWSLAVEEHFYLLFPLLALVLLRRTQPQRAAAVLLGLCAAILVWR